MVVKLPRLTRIAGRPSARMREEDNSTSRVMAIPPARTLSSLERYGSGGGSPAARRKAGARNGASAARLTIHGETEVAKFFARNGPSGWYSHAWMSRADQSFTR